MPICFGSFTASLNKKVSISSKYLIDIIVKVSLAFNNFI